MKMSEKFCSVVLILVIGALAPGAMAVDKPTTAQKTCITAECHADYGKSAFVHTPVGLGDCKACHKPLDPSEHTYEPTRKGTAICTTNCHLDQVVKKHVHEPLEKGDCQQCHDPHSGANKPLLKTATVEELCKECHKVTEGALYLHGPTAVGGCSLCHTPHSSDYEDLMVVEPNDLCVLCHETTKNELEKFEFIHEPAKGNCAGCHDPHGADNNKMLRDSAPKLCFSCHDEIEDTANNSKHKHSVVLDEGGCLECHTPHASTVKFNLKSDPQSLCMNCHDEAQGMSNNEVLPAFLPQIKDKKFLHGPIQERDCAGCHMPHGGENFRLLKKFYPSIFYAPFDEKNYELCFDECHEKTLVLNAKTDNLTDFRNGYQNLHFLHVNKERRGRTCRACHATHASNQPKHIRKSVPYGMWELPLGYQKTETGGGCAPGCHLPKKYDRDNPFDYTIPPAGVKKELVKAASKAEPAEAKSVAEPVEPEGKTESIDPNSSEQVVEADAGQDERADANQV